MKITTFVSAVLEELESQLDGGVVSFDLPILPHSTDNITVTHRNLPNLPRIKFDVRLKNKSSTEKLAENDTVTNP